MSENEVISKALTNAKPISRKRALIELALVIGTLYILKGLILKSEALWTLAGPISLLCCLGIATYCLYRNGQSWADLGLNSSLTKKRLITYTIIAFVLTIITAIVVENFVAPLFERFAANQVQDARYENRFANVQGNLPVFLFWIMVAWVIGGFTEELLFRGFLLTRFEQLFSNVPQAIVIAVFLQAFIFGHQHFYYQGFSGMLATFAVSIVTGILYVKFKRVLWPLVIEHGLTNTIGLTALFLS